jgi:hypothetical protein
VTALHLYFLYAMSGSCLAMHDNRPFRRTPVIDHLCPYCEWSEVDVLRRRGFDWVLSCFGCRPVRCLACLERFYVHKSVVEGHYNADRGRKSRQRYEEHFQQPF